MPRLLSSPSCFLLLIVLLFSPASNSVLEDDTVVVTKSGPIKGKHLLTATGSVTAYLGIPYAEPPLGKLRFQKPLPHKPWSEVLDATSYGNSCPQHNVSGIPDAAIWAPNTPQSENCLFLNIWMPYPRPSMPVPLLVWIHGGGFFTGTASLGVYNGAKVASQLNGVIYVYFRAGFLGEFESPPAAPGNMALSDQQLALNWINENAAAFGGDPTRVTTFGHSSGAASVGFHALSPVSQPLFAQAVMQSGSPNAVWAWMSPEVAKQRSHAAAQMLGCAEGDSNAVVSCLQGKNVTEFVQLEKSLLQNSKFFLDLPFTPTTDGDFLPDDPQKLLEARRFKIKPILIGFTSDEGSIFMALTFPDTDRNLFTKEKLLEGIRMMIRNATEEDVQAVAQKYSEEGQGPARYHWALSQAYGDYFFVCPVAEFAAKMVEAGCPVYAYYFTHHTSGSVWPEWTGAAHGSELPYVFGNLESLLGVNKTYTEAEAALSRRMMGYWTEFARSGKPTGSAADEVEWPLYNTTQQNFFQLSTEPTQVLQRSPVRHCPFLKTLSSKSNKDSAAPGR
ncbi:cholinesterase-like [Rhineura floridana]|uniref:cholinesterase-like n=1 Tax=Rhineura floridana TaxID=261503 RepID=UPI002AC80A8A|nr:cholinesterase-like [Rhineura floridana]XP_061475128.1 cholinesterase-like [Rhineura floridana]XP_061475129.1 cholinesterase-like [Rhineura floridana]XP_061475130.1 cholinesterase-like [Rhineura floridana]XP_061475131.1 cholinesterase-like [Rhineura floridana]